jgi:transcriptional regulator with PAS, ATPase and Fis domain
MSRPPRYEKEAVMPRQLHLTLELPAEVVKHVPANELAEKAKESLVMELLREHRESQGKAAEILGISRYDLFEWMSKYCIPVIDLTLKVLEAELKRPFPRS